MEVNYQQISYMTLIWVHYYVHACIYALMHHLEKSAEVRIHTTKYRYPCSARCLCAMALRVHTRVRLSHHKASRHFQDRNNAHVVGC